MKQIRIIFYLVFFIKTGYSQTNTFPSSGNVGIGTTIPTTGKLVIHGAYPHLILNNPTAGAGSLAIWQDNGTSAGAIGHMNATTALQFSGIDGSTPHMTILSGGNVGIGTTSPGNTLHVNGGISAGDSKFYNSVQLTGNINGATQSWIWAGATNQLHLGVGNVSSLNTKMVIDNTGNVGIGTTNPEYPLQVSTPATDVNITSTTGTNRVSYSAGNAGGSMIVGVESNTGRSLFNTGSLSYSAVFGTTGPYSTQLFTNHSARMTINDIGNVGIGTATPSEKLSVNGNIKTKKLIVTQTGWPDYVFHPAYKLKPLSELEQFIQKNKHLPEVPSAMEVEEKGISVGDNQALLLKKIEELTLYLIQQDKKIDRVIAENKKLKQIIKSKK